LYTANKATFAFHKVVQRHYSGEVGEFIIFWCEIFLGYVQHKLLKSIKCLQSCSKTERGEGLF